MRKKDGNINRRTDRENLTDVLQGFERVQKGSEFSFFATTVHIGRLYKFCLEIVVCRK
jgi:hypothetical protein